MVRTSRPDGSGVVDGFPSQRVSQLAGVPMSTLTYWVATGVVRPSLRGSTGKRATRWWSLSDLVAVRTVKALRDAGCPLQTLRKAQAVIEKSWSESLGNSMLHWDGTDLLSVGAMGDVRSTVRHPGQGVLHVVAVPLGQWRSEALREAQPVDPDELRKRDRARRRRNSRTSATPSRRSS